MEILILYNLNNSYTNLLMVIYTMNGAEPVMENWYYGRSINK